MALSITDLPKEVLALILENLTKPNDRRRAAQVCKLFYDILRHQSTLKHNNVLKLEESATNPIRVFQNSEIFPFSKLHIETGHWHQNVIMESAFWSLHGENINEIIFNDGNISIGNVLPILNAFFPNLKKLTIKSGFSDSSDANSNSQTIPLPIEDLIIDYWKISLDQVSTLFRCSPQLKNLEIKHIDADNLPQILSWLETIEISRVGFDEMPLEKLINLPSKVVIGILSIKVNETPKTIREFFKRPRTIDTLLIHSKYRNEEFDEDEEDEDIPFFVYFTRDQLIALGGAKSIKNVKLWGGVPEFEFSLDLLAQQLPGLETISFDLDEELPNQLYPYYWSLAETAQKIREVDVDGVSSIHCLAGLSSLTSISIWDVDEAWPRVLSNDEIQIMIRNCPNLKKLFLGIGSRIVATDADLIGHGDLLPISSVEKLESLHIASAPNTTLKAFKSAFKFPNLKRFCLNDYNSSDEACDEQIFNQHVAQRFTQNCPNLEFVTVKNCPINLEGLEYLVRHLPYLRDIRIQLKDKRHSLSKDKVKKLQQEFPYITITIREARNDSSSDDSF